MGGARAWVWVAARLLPFPGLQFLDEKRGSSYWNQVAWAAQMGTDFMMASQPVLDNLAGRKSRSYRLPHSSPFLNSCLSFPLAKPVRYRSTPQGRDVRRGKRRYPAISTEFITCFSALYTCSHIIRKIQITPTEFFRILVKGYIHKRLLNRIFSKNGLLWCILSQSWPWLLFILYCYWTGSKKMWIEIKAV